MCCTICAITLALLLARRCPVLKLSGWTVLTVCITDTYDSSLTKFMSSLNVKSLCIACENPTRESDSTR